MTVSVILALASLVAAKASTTACCSASEFGTTVIPMVIGGGVGMLVSQAVRTARMMTMMSEKNFGFKINVLSLITVRV